MLDEGTLTTKRLFILDGVGALVTAGMLGGVLATWEPVFGMPASVLFPLAGVAVAFACYSLSCAWWRRSARYLLPIALANALYCVVTLALLVRFRQSLTGFGLAYFLGEVLVVMALVTVEVRSVIRNSRREHRR